MPWISLLIYLKVCPYAFPYTWLFTWVCHLSSCFSVVWLQINLGTKFLPWQWHRLSFLFKTTYYYIKSGWHFILNHVITLIIQIKIYYWMNYLHFLSSGAVFFILKEILAGCGIYHRQRNECLILITSHKLLFVFKHHFICQKGTEDHLVPTLCLSALHMQTKGKQNYFHRRLKLKVANLGARLFWLSHVLAVLSKPKPWGCSWLVPSPCPQPLGSQKNPMGLDKFPPALRKEDNCAMMDQGWRLFFLSPKGKETAPLGAPVRAGGEHCQFLVPSPGCPWEAVSWHTTCCCWAVSPLVPASLAALPQWLLQLPWKLQQSPKFSFSGMEIVCILECSCPYQAVSFLSSSDPNYHCVFDVWQGESVS